MRFTFNMYDFDGDGYISDDLFPYDPTQWADRDNDGYGDNLDGNNPDAFPDDSNEWKDTDGDNFGDNPEGHEGDACPNERGNSFFDRLGCRDSDGDGWSDPTQNWPASPWGTADSFPTDRLQWEDTDEDGFGDVAMGAKRDDCPDVAGTSTKDLQGCPDKDGDGWSDEYGGWNSAIATLGENPAGSWLTYLAFGSVIFISYGFAVLFRSGKKSNLLTDQSENKEGGEPNA